MTIDAGELTDRVTVLAATGQLRDELNRLVATQQPLYTCWAKVQDTTGADGSLAGAKPEVQTYRVLMRTHPDYAPHTYNAIEWRNVTLDVVSYQVMGTRREYVQLVCSHTDGV